MEPVIDTNEDFETLVQAFYQTLEGRDDVMLNLSSIDRIKEPSGTLSFNAMVYPDGEKDEFLSFGGYHWTGGSFTYIALHHVIELSHRYYGPDAPELKDPNDEASIIEEAREAILKFAPGQESIKALRDPKVELQSGKGGLTGTITFRIRNKYKFWPKASSYWYAIEVGINNKKIETFDPKVIINLGPNGEMGSFQGPFPGTKFFRKRYEFIDSVLAKQDPIDVCGTPADISPGIVAGIEDYRCTSIIDKIDFYQMVLHGKYAGQDVLLRIHKKEKKMEIAQSGYIFEDAPLI